MLLVPPEDRTPATDQPHLLWYWMEDHPELVAVAALAVVVGLVVVLIRRRAGRATRLARERRG